MTGALTNQRVLIHARYSSANQRDASIEDQLRRYAAHVRSLGGHVNDEMVFSDAAISGSSLARPAFERAMELVKTRKVDVFVTEDVSRISRDFADSAAVLHQLEYHYCATNSCLCGNSAINVDAAAQFNEDIGKTPLGSGAFGPGAGVCPCPSGPVGPCCRNGTCTGVCSSPSDTLPSCADAGGSCYLSAGTTCGTAGPPDACAYSDEMCCVPP